LTRAIRHVNRQGFEVGFLNLEPGLTWADAILYYLAEATGDQFKPGDKLKLEESTHAQE
jgi:hypothetical protein